MTHLCISETGSHNSAFDNKSIQMELSFRVQNSGQSVNPQ
jgi:hypothetical protein